MSKPRVVGLWPALILVALGSVIVAIVIFGLVRARADQEARLARLDAQNRELRSRTESLTREAENLRQAAVQPGEPQTQILRERVPPPVNALEQAKTIIHFREQLAAANRSIETLQARIQELQYAVEKSNDENKRLAASEAELKDKASASDRVLTAVQNELKGKADRLTELESSNRRLREESRANSEKLAQLPRSLRDLEEINRRRDGFLTTILRRYRDITDQYRSLSARLERDNSSPGGSELGAIQNAISMTEEDLRQVAGLNAQASRIQQKISGK